MAFDQVVHNYGYDYCEDSKRVLTIKFKDHINSRIIHSCDIAIVYDCDNGKQQYIHFDKNKNTYSWAYQPNSYSLLTEKIEYLKSNGLWNNVREYYIEKKNKNCNPDKHSRSIFAETINEMCQKH